MERVSAKKMNTTMTNGARLAMRFVPLHLEDLVRLCGLLSRIDFEWLLED